MNTIQADADGPEFEGLNCLVTGAASGIGLATAQLLLARGAVVIGADRHPRDAEHPRLRHCIVDVADAQSVNDLAATVASEVERLDVLVNCAGISARTTVEDTTEEAWDAVFAVNARGPWLMTRAFLPLLRASDNAAIVNVASGIGLRPIGGYAPYAASKAALVSLTRSTAVEYGPEGIRANCVCPGPTDTPLLRQGLEETGRTISTDGDYAIARAADPSELAAAIALLCSPRAKHIVGSTLAVDGGRTLH